MSEDGSPSRKKQAKGLAVDPELVPDGETLAKFADYPMLLMECVRIMLEKCSENAVMFRKCGGAQCVHSLVKYESSRGEALKIIQELILNGGREDLGLFHFVNFVISNLSDLKSVMFRLLLLFLLKMNAKPSQIAFTHVKLAQTRWNRMSIDFAMQHNFKPDTRDF